MIVASPLTPLENLLRSILDFFHDTSGCRGRGRSWR